LADYVTVNVSSPNTPGLRGLQNRRRADAAAGHHDQCAGEIVRRCALGTDDAQADSVEDRTDLDLHALDEIADVVRASGIEGLIVSNTTIARPPLRSRHGDEAGGLSGRPLFEPSTRMLAQMHMRLNGGRHLGGVGGIASGQTPMPRSAPAPAWFSFIRRWFFMVPAW